MDLPGVELSLSNPSFTQTSSSIIVLSKLAGDMPCTELASILAKGAENAAVVKPLTTKVLCDGQEIAVDGYFVEGNTTLSSLKALQASSSLSFNVFDTFVQSTSSRIPVICLAFINIILAGALGGIMFHMASSVDHRVQIFIPFTREQVKGPDGSLKFQPKALEPTILADAFCGSIAAIVTMCAALEFTNFSIDPILLSDIDCYLRFHDISQHCATTNTFRTWIVLYSMSILGGFGGLRLVSMFSNKLMHQLNKRIQVQEEAMMVTQDAISEHSAANHYIDGCRRQESGFHRDAIRCFEKANSQQELAKHYSAIAYSQSYLIPEPALDDALQSIAKAFKLLVTEKDVDDSTRYALHYNRACISHLKEKIQREPLNYIGQLITDFKAAFAINEKQFRIDLKGDIAPGGDLHDLYSLATKGELDPFKLALEHFYAAHIDDIGF